MKKYIIAFLMLGSTAFAQADIQPSSPNPNTNGIFYTAQDSTPSEFMWINRPLVIFSDSPNDPRTSEQIELLQERENELIERDVIVIVDNDRPANSPWRRLLRPNGFGIVLLSKDGTVVFRKPHPWTVREITRSIDKLPLRQQELSTR